MYRTAEQAERAVREAYGANIYTHKVGVVAVKSSLRGKIGYEYRVVITGSLPGSKWEVRRNRLERLVKSVCN